MMTSKSIETLIAGRLSPENRNSNRKALLLGSVIISYVSVTGSLLAQADDLVREASKFIRKHKDQPFFLFFSASDIHAPRWPHSRFRGKSDHGLRGDAMVSFDWSAGTIVIVTSEMNALLEKYLAEPLRP